MDILVRCLWIFPGEDDHRSVFSSWSGSKNLKSSSKFSNFLPLFSPLLLRNVRLKTIHIHYRNWHIPQKLKFSLKPASGIRHSIGYCFTNTLSFLFKLASFYTFHSGYSILLSVLYMYDTVFFFCFFKNSSIEGMRWMSTYCYWLCILASLGLVRQLQSMTGSFYRTMPTWEKTQAGKWSVEGWDLCIHSS